MTIQKAWDIYDIEVKQKKEFYKKEMEKKSNTYLIIGLILLFIGLILTISGFSAPKEKTRYSDGTFSESTTMEAFGLKISGIGLLSVGSFSLIYSNSYNKKSKKGPGFMQENKRLYINCLSASDISEEEKLYYTQELEEI